MAQDTPAEMPEGTNSREGNEPSAEGTPKLYAGKYRSIEAMEQGYWQTAQEGLRWRDQARAKDQRIADLEAALAAKQERQTEEVFEESGLPLGALDARIEQKALGLLKQTLGPVFMANEAESQLMQQFPDFPGMAQIQRDLDPDVAESYRKLLSMEPQAAMSMAYKVWKSKQSGKAESMSKDEIIQETRKRDAGRAKSTRQGNGEEQEAVFNSQRYADAVAHGKTTNDWNPLIRMQFGQTDWYKRMASGEDDEW